MGKKGKIGKHRKDRFYHLAKETGYRSRAAFKLIQLNRKFEFLQQSKVLIDLCAAPGGWLQVAQKYMPVQSVILGIDLAPIKSIFNVTTLQEDITTQKCRTFISKELKTWKADCVLHDGAPNVGKSWIHDAFEQNRLTLAALHLACDFLMKGGWFVTKVFRSKDYNALMWVFKKLFKRVHATKPQASRNESAEIFVVCQHYLAPDKIDPKFFDASSVFADLREKETTITKGDLLKAITNPKRAKAEGYEEGQAAVYKKLLGSEFMVSKNYIDLLSKSNEIVLDRKDIREHPATTFEVQECIKDLKVLGKKELNLIFNWRTAVRDHLKKTATQENQDQFSDDEVIPEVLEEPEEETEESEEAKKLKRIKRKVSKEKRKLEEKLSLKMVLKNDQLIEEEQELFNLADIKRKAAHTIMKDDEQGAVLSDSDDDQPERLKRVIKVKVDKDSADRFYDPDDSDNEIELDEADDDFKPLHFEDDSEEEPEQDQNDMVIDFDTKQDKADELTKRFFENKLFQTRKSTGAKDAADFIEDGDDLELKEIQNRIYKAQKLKSLDFRPSANDDSENEENVKNVAFMDVDGADDAGPKSPEDPMAKFDDDSEDDSSGDDDDDEDGNEKSGSGKVLTPEEMALGAMLVKSKKARREMMDHGWNRYVQEDDDFIPSWFRKEESQFFRKPTPVTEEMVKEYNEKLREINSKPIKKVLEAKQRKKKRAIRKLEKARLKAESITDDADMTNKEKAQYIRSIYKRAVKKNTDKVQLVVGKKQYGKSRPPGVKGRYKIVDSRLKKDKRAQVNKEKTKSRGKKTSSKKPAGKKTPQGGRNKTRTGKGR